ncbi:hypothetical protein DM860_007046 [Cuscuta australis]|uniref:Uncharacterized protein n=1 Tax=Cuscuta australis TaxID=267555 RepID=A0A328E5S0_9ASTE|nr:hypothetical protein DM860_007046 [Cuscuta australis]
MNCPFHFPSVYHAGNQPERRRFYVLYRRHNNKPPPYRFSPSSPRRRHHRRRLLHKFFPDYSTGFGPSSSPFGKSLKLTPAVLSVPTRPLHRFRDVIESKLGEFLDSGRKAVEDLQTLVLVDDSTGEVVISCSRSTVQFLGTIFLSSIIIHFTIRGLSKLVALGFRKNHSAGNAQLVYKRDRSLSGREVLVAKREGTDVRTYTNRVNMLQSIDAEGNEILGSLDQVRGKRSSKRSSSVTRLPKWWPAFTDSCQGPMEYQEENQRIANKLVRAILDNRMSGRDVLENDIIQLRQICKPSKVRVSFSTEHARDSLYRTSVDYVLNFCESTVNQLGPIHIDGEDVQKFIAGLADNIDIENTRAARMVSAAVAARTRSRLLQAWSKHVGAVDELRKICFIHKIFPPEECSAEMEMVGRGLQKHLNVDQRKFLLNMFRGICGENSDRGVAEALGLSLDDAVSQQVANDSMNDCT